MLQFAVKLVAVTSVAFSACGAAGVGVGVAVGVPGGVIVGVGGNRYTQIEDKQNAKR